MTQARLAVIVGAPRSGTTWLQRLLATHAAVASPQETHLFDNYLAHLYAQWRIQEHYVQLVLPYLERDEVPPRRLLGLPTIMDEDQFDELCHAFVTGLIDRTVAAKPGASVVLEKTPTNSRQTELINRLIPDALFIHIIRDPRDVIPSLLAATDWGGPRFAPVSTGEAAERWRRRFHDARSAHRFGNRYVEVRYEDLVRDTVPELQRLFDFCGVSADQNECERLVNAVGSTRDATAAQYAFAPGVAARLATHVIREPAGFARHPGAGRRKLSAAARLTIERRVGQELRDLGYAADGSWVDIKPLARAVLEMPQRLPQPVRSIAGRVSHRIRSVHRTLTRGTLLSRPTDELVPER